MRYSVEFIITNGLQTDPEPWQFTARDHRAAQAEIALTLGTTMPITRRKLESRGVKKILCGGIELPAEKLAGFIVEPIQAKLLAVAETWRLSDEPEFRGFRCAYCQTDFTGQAWHHLLHEGGYITPVHFCKTCQAAFHDLSQVLKPRACVDRERFKPIFKTRTLVALNKISQKWNISDSEPVFKDFTCDACVQPLEIIDGRPQGWHVWRNKDGTLIEYHFDRTCGEKILRQNSRRGLSGLH